MVKHKLDDGEYVVSVVPLDVGPQRIEHRLLATTNLGRSYFILAAVGSGITDDETYIITLETE